jgi:prevent-host-death family protein
MAKAAESIKTARRYGSLWANRHYCAMAIQVDIAKAKARLSERVARAEAGEDVVISRRGRPDVTLTPSVRPSEPRDGRRRLGVWEHFNLSIPLSAFEPHPSDEDLKA